MSPTNLGQLLSNDPLPTGNAQCKRGQGGVNEITLNNTYSARALQDGNNHSMYVEVVPWRKGWWQIHAETIWRTPDATWTYFHWGVRLCNSAGQAITDLDGRSDYRAHQPLHSAQTWQASVINCMYKLDTNFVYQAEMYWPNSSLGYNMIYWTGADFHFIIGEFLEDHAL